MLSTVEGASMTAKMYKKQWFTTDDKVALKTNQFPQYKLHTNYLSKEHKPDRKVHRTPTIAHWNNAIKQRTVTSAEISIKDV